MSVQVERREPLELPDLLVGRQRRRRPGRIARKDTGLAVDQVRVLPVACRHELEIEPGATLELCRHWLVDEHRDLEPRTVRRDDEARVEVEGLVAHRAGDRVGRRIDLAIDELRDLIPLLGRGAEAHGAAGRDAHAVLDDLDAGRLLVEEHAVVLVREDEDVEAARLEILLVVEGQRAGLSDGGDGPESDDGKREGPGKAGGADHEGSLSEGIAVGRGFSPGVPNALVDRWRG